MTFIPQVLTTNDPNNSTTTLLNPPIGKTFNGTGTLTTGYNSIILTIQSNVGSAPGGIKIQFSKDNITYYSLNTTTYFPSPVLIQNYQIIDKYYRIIYTNGDTNQSTFTLNSRLSTSTQNVTLNNTSITSFDNKTENTQDAFGKLRVSNPYTLLDIRYPGQSTGYANFLSNNIQICTKTSGSVSGTPSDSKLVMSCTGTGYYMTQSRNYCTYQPGKSLLFLASGIINSGGNGSTVTTRIGYYESDVGTTPPTVKHGLYFEYSTQQMFVCLKNNTTSTSLRQTDWNIDQMDGTGPSGLILDFTKAQLFVIDLEWLGVGRVRFGFFAYGRIQYCHQFTNVNSLIGPYTDTINLPISYSLISQEGGIGSLTQICSTVISEGGYNPVGKPFSVSNSQNGSNSPVTVGTTEVPLLAIRGGGLNYNHQNIIPTGISIIDTATNNNLLYRLRLYLAPNSPITSGLIGWTDVDTNDSVVQFAKSTNFPTPSVFTTADSIVLDQNYFYGRGTISFNGLGDVFSSKILQLTANIDNVADILVLTCQKIGSNTTDVYSTISWQEIY